MNCKECNHPTDEHIHKLVGCVHLEIAANGDGIGCACMLDQQAAEHGVQRIGLLARFKSWWLAQIANR